MAGRGVVRTGSRVGKRVGETDGIELERDRALIPETAGAFKNPAFCNTAVCPAPTETGFGTADAMSEPEVGLDDMD